MEPVLTAAQMRQADEACIAAGTPGFELMDRAAHACATVALRMLGGGYGRRICIVAGSGNNGGDGIAAAVHLARAGAGVDLLLLGEPSGDPAAHLRRLPSSVRVSSWRTPAACDLVLDAMLGT